MDNKLTLRELVEFYKTQNLTDPNDLGALDVLRNLLETGGNGTLLSDNTETSESTEDSEDSEDSESTESTESTESSEDSENSEDTENNEDTGLDLRFNMPPELIYVVPDELMRLKPSEIVEKIIVKD